LRWCGDLGDRLRDTGGANLLVLHLLDRSLAALRLIAICGLLSELVELVLVRGPFRLGLLGGLLLFVLLGLRPLLLLLRLLLLSDVLCLRSHLRHLAGLLGRKVFLLLVRPEAASDIAQTRLVGALGGKLGGKLDRSWSYIRSAYVMLVFLSTSWRCLTLDCALHLPDPLVRRINHRLALSVPLFFQLLKGAIRKHRIELDALSEACFNSLLVSQFPGGFGRVDEPLDVAPNLAHSDRLLGDFAVADTGTRRRDVADLVHWAHETGGFGRMQDGVLGDFGRMTFQVRHLVGSAKQGKKELRLGRWD
jgi:hypothetical protein